MNLPSILYSLLAYNSALILKDKRSKKRKRPEPDKMEINYVLGSHVITKICFLSPLNIFSNSQQIFLPTASPTSLHFHSRICGCIFSTIVLSLLNDASTFHKDTNYSNGEDRQRCKTARNKDPVF